ncbi:hypothetical protein B0H66DRAFT_587511 [Apodospora peruviana]|uniref:Uncharacterized protein n=1 Tax=Apodospora peruviana TaxID=516989 RepID=A0AAE0MHK3_9PEZI|nr:hypothetical protein B0H66DRAFT_587511 [Apodospora peruviana]
MDLTADLMDPQPASPRLSQAPTEVDTDGDGKPETVEVGKYGEGRRYRQRHGDHWDTLSTYNIWTNTSIRDPITGDPVGIWWQQDWMFYDDESESFEQLYSSRCSGWIKAFLKKLGCLSRQNYLSPVSADYRNCHIPLFQDPDSGDEYQLEPCELINLPRLRCGEYRKSADGLVLLQGRAVPPSASCQEDGLPSPPRHAIQLGTLHVRTLTARSKAEEWDEDLPATEQTNYSIVLDAESDDFPMWLILSRPQLKDCRIDDQFVEIPFFRGLLNDESTDYDCACLLNSVHRLDPDNPSAAPAFSEVLDMIRKTRRIMDPIYSDVPEDQLRKYVAGEPFDYLMPSVWPADPDLEVKITARYPDVPTAVIPTAGSSAGLGDEEDVDAAPPSDAAGAGHDQEDQGAKEDALI